MSNKAKFYLEWLYIIKNYLDSITKDIKRYEIYTPMIISAFYTFAYYKNDKLEIALDNFSSILPNILSILIGFTITILMIMPSVKDEIESKIKKNKEDKMSPFHQLLSQFSYNVFIELILLCLIFIDMSLDGFEIDISAITIINTIFFGIELFLLLNILFSTIRSITNIFFLFSSFCKKNK